MRGQSDQRADRPLPAGARGVADHGRQARSAAELIERLARLADGHPSAAAFRAGRAADGAAGDAPSADGAAADQWWRGSAGDTGSADRDAAGAGQAQLRDQADQPGAGLGGPDAGPAGREEHSAEVAGPGSAGIAASEGAADCGAARPRDVTAGFLTADREPYRPWFAGDAGLDPWFAP